jgi:hypothetical protein
VLVWERVEGQPLSEYLASSVADDSRLRTLARELIANVEAMHALGIVHGAIHGRNVIVTPRGGVKLTHVSPLLHTDPQVDVEAVVSLLAELGLLEAVEGTVAELRELRPRLDDASAMARPADGDAHAERSLLTPRRLALAGAAAAALAGALLAWAFWRVSGDSDGTASATVVSPEVVCT